MSGSFYKLPSSNLLANPIGEAIAQGKAETQYASQPDGGRELVTGHEEPARPCRIGWNVRDFVSGRVQGRFGVAPHEGPATGMLTEAERLLDERGVLPTDQESPARATSRLGQDPYGRWQRRWAGHFPDIATPSSK
jgi:hypothetical protein